MPVVTEDASHTRPGVRRDRVAPWQHTALVVLVCVLWALFGALRANHGFGSDTPRWLRYSGQLLVLWLMTGTTVAGLYHRRRFIRAVVGHIDLIRDAWAGLWIFLGGTAVLLLAGVLLRPLHFLHLTRLHDAVLALAPHTKLELALWMIVCVSAGICEEFMFRGYLLRQVLSWTGSSAVAVVVTAVLFGGMHLYEGTAAAVQIGALGAWFGVMAIRRGSLRQVMIAHFLQDAIAGLVLFLRH